MDVRLIDQISNEQWQRVFRKIHFAESCWQWTGAIKSTGYGHFRCREKTLLAHRAVYELCVGPIPVGLYIDHLCRNKRCVNPDHLRVVTPRQNVLENSMSGPARCIRRTHCDKGHPLTPDNVRLYRKAGRNGKSVARKCKTCAQQRWLLDYLKYRERKLAVSRQYYRENAETICQKKRVAREAQ